MGVGPPSSPPGHPGIEKARGLRIRNEKANPETVSRRNQKANHETASRRRKRRKFLQIIFG
jgi:hypothetical protein